jgi:hypothetical protein
MKTGYGATTDGTWPYSYDSCDVGILPNQTYLNGTGPYSALHSPSDGSLSYLPGQRWSSCTCKGEDHPGPDVSVGRGVPEVDLIEAHKYLVFNPNHASASCLPERFPGQHKSLSIPQQAKCPRRCKLRLTTPIGSLIIPQRCWLIPTSRRTTRILEVFTSSLALYSPRFRMHRTKRPVREQKRQRWRIHHLGL